MQHEGIGVWCLLVIERANNLVLGREAVIDKDRASSLLAVSLGVALFIISTDVPQVFVDYKKPTQRALSSVTVRELEGYRSQKQFAAGSMGPKVESVIRFVQETGHKAIITSFECLIDALDGNVGTHILP